MVPSKCGIRNVSKQLSGMTGTLSSFDFAGFVNAQYRFVVHPAGDYTVHFADPDMYVPPCTLLSDAS